MQGFFTGRRAGPLTLYKTDVCPWGWPKITNNVIVTREQGEGCGSLVPMGVQLPSSRKSHLLSYSPRLSGGEMKNYTAGTVVYA